MQSVVREGGDTEKGERGEEDHRRDDERYERNKPAQKERRGAGP